jgi:septal ring-binding cell division protein DamX
MPAIRQADSRAPVVVPASGSRSVAARSDIIATRMQATSQWLKSGDPSAYTIQLFVAQNEQHLRKHLRMLTNFIGSNDLYLYRTAGQGRDPVTVLWGNFPDRRSAEQQLKQLPAWIRANRPYLRTLSGIRAEVQQLQASR